MKKKILFIFALLVLVASSKITKAQIVCDSAMLLTQSPVCNYYQQTVPAGNTEYWYKFVADSSDVNVSTIQYGIPIGMQSLIELYSYSGTCDSLTQMGQHTQTLGITGLTFGETYYIRVYQYGMTDFGICIAPFDCVAYPNFEINPNPACPYDLVNLIDVTHSNDYCATAYMIWNLSSLGLSPITDNTWPQSHPITAPSTPGTYPITLCFYDGSNALLACKTLDLVVIDIPTTSFTFTPTSPSCTNTFYFVDQSTYLTWNQMNPPLHWDFGDGNTDDSNPGSTVSNTYAPGTYTVTLTATNQCGTTTTTATITVYPPPTISITPLNPQVCLGASTTLFAWGANTYEWSPSTGLSATTGASVAAQPSATTTYTVTGTDINGCSATTSITVLVLPSPNIAVSPANSSICTGESTTLIATGASSYTWSPALGLSATTGNTVIANPTTTTIYTVSGVATNGCIGTAVANITVYPSPDVPIITGNNNNCDGLTVYTISNYDPTINSYSYNVDGLVNHSISSNSFTIDWSVYADTDHTLYVFVINQFGCTAKTSFTVFKCCRIFDIGLHNNEIFDTPGTYGGSFIINGNLTIDADVIFDDAEVYMGPEASITINTNHTLTIQNGSILHEGCDYMWDGIYIKDNTAHLNITGSFIYDAINAVVSEQGGVYTISQSTFGRNYKNIYVNPYYLSHLGTIQSTHFVGNTLLLNPHINDRTYVGVEITNVNHIQIGTVGNYSMRNFFDNMDFGIKASVTDVDIYNNSFGHIDCSTCSMLDFYTPPKGVAIMVEGRKGFTHTVNVGDVNSSPSLLRENSFPQCFMGVHAYFNLNINVKNNTFISSLFGVFVHHNNFITNIRNNTFACSMGGPGFMAIGSAEMTIDNVIDIMNNNIQNYTTGIYARNVFEDNVRKLTIGENTISSHLTNNGVIGIMATNVKGLAPWGGNLKPYAYILNNTITFYNPSYSTTNYTGILVQGCEKVNLEQNTISKFGPALSNGTYAMNLNGINVALSPEALLCNNITEKLGCGLRFKGKMPATLTTNEMRKCFYGVQFDNAYIGNQGTSGSTWDNRWTYPGVPPVGWQKVNGVLLIPSNWYYKGSTSSSNPLKPDPNSIPPGFLNLYNISPQSIVVCGSQNPNFTTRFNAIVNNQTNYSINNFANKYLEKKYAFKNLRANPDTLQALAIAQPVYQTFYDSVSAATIGNFETVIDSVHQASFAYAANINNSIVAIDTIDVNQKSVIDIYLKTWANGIYEFTQNQYDSLYQIAMQDEVTGGFGVYGARVMLGIEPNFMNILKTTTPIESIKKVESKMYPNPAKDEAYFDYYLEEGQQGELNIYNIIGQLLQKYILTANENHVIIITTRLGQGVYIYSLKVDNSIVTNDKFVILK